MLVGGGGGGSISVEPAVLDSLAAQVGSVASGTSSTRGEVGGASSAAAGCQEPAGEAFARLQLLLDAALACLGDCSGSISRATFSAANAYVTTEATQMPMSIHG